MSVKTVRHRLLYVRDSLQSSLFVVLTNTKWLSALSPLLAFVIRPLLGATLSTLALLQTWTFIHSHYKNIDGWLATGGALGGALLNNIAAFGGFIARAIGSTFIWAPWFFIAGFSVGAVFQASMALINAWRAFESPYNSVQRKHYLQTFAFNLLSTLQLSSCAAAIFVFNVFPAYSLLVAGFAITVVTINLGNSIWRFLSSESKKEIKNFLGFGKPAEVDSSLDYVNKISSKENHSVSLKSFPRLFTTCDHRLEIKKLPFSEREPYLITYISRKIAVLEKGAKSEKNEQKIAVLQLLRRVVLEEEPMQDKAKLHKKYPKLIDNFWCEKSDTDQLIDAVTYYSKSLNDAKPQCSKMHPCGPKDGGVRG